MAPGNFGILAVLPILANAGARRFCLGGDGSLSLDINPARPNVVNSLGRCISMTSGEHSNGFCKLEGSKAALGKKKGCGAAAWPVPAIFMVFGSLMSFEACVAFSTNEAAARLPFK